MTRATIVAAASAVALVCPSLAFAEDGWIPGARLDQGLSSLTSAPDQRHRKHRHFSIGQEISGGLVETSTIGQPIGPNQRQPNPAIVVVFSGVSDSSVARLQTRPASSLNRVDTSSTTSSQTSSPASTSRAATLAGPAAVSTPVANTPSLPASAQRSGVASADVHSQVRTANAAEGPSRGRRGLVENGLSGVYKGSALVGNVVGSVRVNVPSAADISAPLSIRANSNSNLGQVGGLERTLDKSLVSSGQAGGMPNQATIGRTVGGAAPGITNLTAVSGQVGAGAAAAARSPDTLGQVGGSLPRLSGSDRRGG